MTNRPPLKRRVWGDAEKSPPGEPAMKRCFLENKNSQPTKPKVNDPLTCSVYFAVVVLLVAVVLVVVFVAVLVVVVAYCRCSCSCSWFCMFLLLWLLRFRFQHSFFRRIPFASYVKLHHRRGRRWGSFQGEAHYSCSVLFWFRDIQRVNLRNSISVLGFKNKTTGKPAHFSLRLNSPTATFSYHLG